MMDWILKRRGKVLAALIVITACFCLFIPRLSFTTSVYDLVIEDLHEMISTRIQGDFRIGRDHPGRHQGRRRFRYAHLPKIEQLAEIAKKIEGVQRVISLPAVKRAVDLSGDWPMTKFKASSPMSRCSKRTSYPATTEPPC